MYQEFRGVRIMAYSDIKDPSAYFQTLLWTGNSTDGRALTNDGNSDLQPDWVWLKNRNAGYNHFLQDSSRGNTKVLNSDSTAAESTSTNFVESFDTNGFTVGFDGSQVPNFNGNTFVAWQWKANGGTTVSNTDGDLRNVTVQANQDAGFSIVEFLGGTTPYTAGHGLGVAPDVIISKRRGATVGWYVYHKDVGAGKYLQINNANAAVTSATEAFTSAPTSTIFTGGTGVGGASDYWINYCFASKQGYSKFGSYVGNGRTDGPFIYTGFKPAWIMVKDTESSGDNWQILDTKRDPHNPQLKYLQADNENAEGSFTFVDILSNGFKFRSTYSVGPNVNGHKTIYMAFAENPFVAGGIPTTAR